MTKETVDAAIATLETWGRVVDNWVLICAAGVAIFLAAEVVFSVSHWLNERNLRPLRVLQSDFHAKELIALGKSADEAKERAAKAELALEKFRAPRTLSRDEEAAITAEMKTFTRTPLVFGVFQEPEAFALLDQISRTLTQAGWIEQEWKSGGDIVVTRGGGHPIAGYTFVTGVYVQADASHAADFGPIVEKLAKLLSDAGIQAKAEVGRMSPNTNNDAIKILIGQKPR